MNTVGSRRITTAALAIGAAAIGALATAPAALAAPGTLTFGGTFATFQMNNVGDTVVSPDGKHVYISSFSSGDGSVTAASRNPATGELTFIDEYLEIDDGVEGIGGAEAIAISPDGKSVYVAGDNTDSVAMFERNSTTGTLDFQEAYFDGEGGVTHLGGASDVAVSPDGLSVYATGFDDDGLNVFGRDPGTGELNFVDAEIEGINGVSGLKEIHAVTVSPDGENVYTASQQDSDVTTFTRFGTGVLSFLETDSNPDATLGAFELAVSPDNANVYVIGRAANAVSEWDRAANGALAFGSMIEDGVQTEQLSDPRGVAISPDGGHVYVTTALDDSLLTLDRATGGALSVREFHKDGQAGVNGLNGADGLALSKDGSSLYVAGGDDDRIAEFRRELPPPPPVDPGQGGGGGTALTLELDGKAKQKAKKLAVTATCSIACDLSGSAKGKAGGEKLKSKRAADELAAGESAKLRLKLGRKALRTAKGERGKLTATVVAEAGAERVVEKLKLKLKP
jgi:DNA-binding beta-propeller fold protein YncE